VQDLNREVIRSATATVCIPELELELTGDGCGGGGGGGIGGVVTTVEGILKKMHERLRNVTPMGGMIRDVNDGDASSSTEHHDQGQQEQQQQYKQFLDKLENMAEGKSFPFTLILSDPFSKSFVGPIISQNAIEDTKEAILRKSTMTTPSILDKKKGELLKKEDDGDDRLTIQNFNQAK